MRLEPAPAVVLTGASSSGKSTLALELQRLAPRPMVFLSGDAMDLPAEALSSRYLKSLPDAEGEFWQDSVHRAFYRTLAVWADAGIGVIGEALFKSEREVEIVGRSSPGDGSSLCGSYVMRQFASIARPAGVTGPLGRRLPYGSGYRTTSTWRLIRRRRRRSTPPAESSIGYTPWAARPAGP